MTRTGTVSGEDLTYLAGDALDSQALSDTGDGLVAMADAKDDQRSPHIQFQTHKWLTAVLAFVNKPNIQETPGFQAVVKKSSRRNDVEKITRSVRGFVAPKIKTADAALAIVFFSRLVKNGLPSLSPRDRREFRRLQRTMPQALRQRRGPNLYASLEGSATAPRPRKTVVLSKENQTLTHLAGLTDESGLPKHSGVDLREIAAPAPRPRKLGRTPKTDQYADLNAQLQASAVMAPMRPESKKRVADAYLYEKATNG